jgi:hypothetical protein
LRKYLDDFIERINVYEFEGKDKFETYFNDNVKSELLAKYPEIGS